MREQIVLTIQVVKKSKDGTEVILNEFQLPLVGEEEDEYLRAVKFREPLYVFEVPGNECLRAKFVEIYNDCAANIGIAPTEKLEVRCINKPEDTPMTRKEAEETLREMFEAGDWDIDQIARYCRYNFARCYRGGYSAFVKLVKSIAAEYVDEDDLENWFEW